MKYLITLITLITMGISDEGEISGVTYFDYINSEDISAFNFERQYFSYSVQASDDIKYKIIFDAGRINKIVDSDGKEEDTRVVIFLKKAQIDYKTSYGNVSMGIIGMNTYNVQEKNWGFRFIEKSAIDKHKFSSTADLGVGFSRSVIENLNISLQIVNGEGYKEPQKDKYYKISFNSTYGEGKLNTNDGYNTGVVYSTESSETDPTTMISVFGGCAGNGLRVGGEYDVLTNSDGTKKIYDYFGNQQVVQKHL